MEKVHYPTTVKKVVFSIITLLLFIATLVDMNTMHNAWFVLISMVTLMFHFNIYESTADTNKLNKFDFVLQIVFLVVSFIKFFILSGLS